MELSVGLGRDLSGAGEFELDLSFDEGAAVARAVCKWFKHPASPSGLR